MSRETVLKFFSKAAEDEQLKARVQSVKSKEELHDLASQEGFEFSSEDVNTALAELKHKPGFLQYITDIIFDIFNPGHDDYPATGTQPFSGDPNP